MSAILTFCWRGWLTWCFDPLVLLGRKPQTTGSKPQVCIVFIAALGDFAIFAATLKALRQHYKGYQITLVIDERCRPLADQAGHYDQVVALNRRKFRYHLAYRTKVLSGLKAAKFDIAINAYYSRHILYGDALIRATGAPLRLGQSGDHHNCGPFWQSYSRRYYTTLVNNPPSDQMELCHHRTLLASLGACFTPTPPWLTPKAPPQSRITGDYLIIFPGAGWSGNRWPLERFSKVASRAQAQTGWQIAICGSPDEALLCQRLGHLIQAPTVNLCLPGSTLRDALGYIAGARLLIGNDSGAVHLATALGRPALAVCGRSNGQRFLPYRSKPTGQTWPNPVVVTAPGGCSGCYRSCTEPFSPGGPTACIAAITPEMAWKQLLPLLEQLKAEMTAKKN